MTQTEFINELRQLIAKGETAELDLQGQATLRGLKAAARPYRTKLEPVATNSNVGKVVVQAGAKPALTKATAPQVVKSENEELIDSLKEMDEAAIGKKYRSAAQVRKIAELVGSDTTGTKKEMIADMVKTLNG